VPLAEIQLLFRNAIVADDAIRILPFLAGGRDPEKGLGIHRRNYETSLVTALLTKFPATVWLAGTSFVTEAASCFVRERPPRAPCIAEYGLEFPQFLAALPAAARMPYLEEFAELEWHVGKVAVEIDERCLSGEDLSKIDQDALPDLVLRVQAGVRYREASWPIDDLLKLYLSETAPDQYALEPAGVWMEVRGARGEFLIDRLDPSEFIFRKSISEGSSIGAAAECALDVDLSFDPCRALARLINAGLVIGIKENGGQP
jgi:hypothetical protein